MINDFLPISRADMEKRGWNQCDFVYLTGDAYVDHPSFGHAIISRVDVYKRQCRLCLSYFRLYLPAICLSWASIIFFTI